MIVSESAVVHIVIVTTYYPNAVDPHRAVFVANLVREMQAHCTVTVVSPVPYAPPFKWLRRRYPQSQLPARETIGGVDVLHPRFVAVPRLGWLNGFTYALAVVSILRRLARLHERLILHAHCAYPDGVGVSWVARWLGLRYYITAHGSDINVYAQRVGYRAQIAGAMRRATGVIAVSGDLENKITGLVGTSSHIRRIPCAGFFPDLFMLRSDAELRPAFGLTPQARVVVFVGQLVSIKGVRFLIDAWSRLAIQGVLGPDDRLLIAGEGPLRAELEARAKEANVASSVRFLGGVPYARIGQLLACANALCLPSRNEGTPNVVVEALASGVPVVASRVGGVPELVREGVNGFLVDSGDVVALAARLRDVFDARWDRQAIRAGVAHLTWTEIAARNCAFLQEGEQGATNASSA